MKLYVGGAHQNQAQLAAEQHPDAELLVDFHDVVREWLAQNEDVDVHVEALIREKPELVVITNEMGSGIVPMDRDDRAWREASGRALCRIARASDEVVRVVCGIGVKIK